MAVLVSANVQSKAVVVAALLVVLEKFFEVVLNLPSINRFFAVVQGSIMFLNAAGTSLKQHVEAIERATLDWQFEMEHPRLLSSDGFPLLHQTFLLSSGTPGFVI